MRKRANGGGLMTQTTVNAQVVSAVSNLLCNGPLEKALPDNLERLGPPPFDVADRTFGRKIQTTVSRTSYVCPLPDEIDPRVQMSTRRKPLPGRGEGSGAKLRG